MLDTALPETEVVGWVLKATTARGSYYASYAGKCLGRNFYHYTTRPCQAWVFPASKVALDARVRIHQGVRHLQWVACARVHAPVREVK